MFFRLLTRAPRTRIVSWVSGRDGSDRDAVLVSAFTRPSMPESVGHPRPDAIPGEGQWGQWGQWVTASTW